MSRDRVKAIVLYQPGSLQEDVWKIRPEATGAPGVVDNQIVNDTALPSEGESESEPQRSTLYLLTDRSVLQSIDAETGRTNWSRIVGNPNRPALGPTICSKYVAIVNGSVLYFLDVGTGETLSQQRLTRPPISSVAMTDDWTYVPAADGTIMALNLDAPETNWSYASGVAVEVPPVITRDTVAWSTRYGQLYMGQKSTGRVTRRFDAGSASAVPPTYWPPYIYTSSLNGYVNAIHERSGVAVWRFSSGSPIYEPVVSFEKNLYVITDLGGMYCLAKDGSKQWYADGITKMLAASPARVFAVDRFNRLVSLDRSTGSLLGTMPLFEQKVQLINMVNDRIYVCTEKGLLQCLHEIGQEEPIIHSAPEEETPEDAAGNANQATDIRN
ncbi:MAG: PQQ-like beta-propeller repeat protein [Pirellulales bacterium]|nr:PQQ-like beta-propeller repeat protein [Pirellulales bacterium]